MKTEAEIHEEIDVCEFQFQQVKRVYQKNYWLARQEALRWVLGEGMWS